MSKIQSQPDLLISDGKILSMYEAILPLLYRNPEKLNVAGQINKCLLAFIDYDFCHYIMDTNGADHAHGRLNMIFEEWRGKGQLRSAPSVSIQSTQSENLNATFEADVERNYQIAIARSKKTRPDIHEYHYHRIESQTHPKIVIGFFRYKEKRSNRDFSVLEKNIFKALAPHIVLLYRSVLNHAYHSQAFQYFESLTQLGSKLATDHDLSNSEVRLIPDILIGKTNEEMADEHFVSVATVKSHIKHILKKTGTKNRIDFISKFFTSPDSVKL